MITKLKPYAKAAMAALGVVLIVLSAFLVHNARTDRFGAHRRADRRGCVPRPESARAPDRSGGVEGRAGIP